MPRYNTEREFQLGVYWLSKQSRSPAWCRTWFDTAARQTKRASLGTADFDEAKQKLTDWFVGQHNQITEPNKAQEPCLAEVLSRYYEQHAAKLPSAGRAKISLRYWLEFWGEAEVSDVASLVRQEEFNAWLRKRGQSDGSIRRIQTSGRAAINRAWKRGEISRPIPIHMVPVRDEPPKGRPLDLEEVSALLAASPKHLQDFILWGVATGSRPQALVDLRWRQVDLRAGLINLNSPGRPQTKKYRPTVRMPHNLLEMVGGPGNSGDAPIAYKGSPVKSVRNAWRKARAAAELGDQVQPYSLRHTVARWLRMSGVPAWQVAAQLGHATAQHSMTERYAPYDPSYLQETTKAIEGYLERLRVNCV